MSDFNSRENLEAILEVVQLPKPPIEDDEESGEDCPFMGVVQEMEISEVETVLNVTGYPTDFADSNIVFHGSAPEGSPAEEHGDWAE
jgi:hypothetical protein